MAIAHHTRNLPLAVLSLPDHHVLEDAAVVPAVLHMAEAVKAGFYGAVIFYRVYFKAFLYNVPSQARVAVVGKQDFEFFHCLQVIINSAFIVVKLQVFGKEGLQLFNVLLIKGREHQAVHAGNGIVQLFGRRCIGLVGSAGIASCRGAGKSKYKKQNGSRGQVYFDKEFLFQDLYVLGLI